MSAVREARYRAFVKWYEATCDEGERLIEDIANAPVPAGLTAVAEKWEADADFIEAGQAGTKVRRAVVAETLRACAAELRAEGIAATVDVGRLATAMGEVFGKECDDARNVGIRPSGRELEAWNYVVNHFDQFAAKVAPAEVAAVYASLPPSEPAT